MPINAHKLSTAKRYCDAGFGLVSLRGKRADRKGWQFNRPISADKVEDFLGSCVDGQFGAVLSKNHLVIDVDPRHFKKGDKPFSRLLSDVGMGLRALLDVAAVVRTGGAGRGLHIYMSLPDGVSVKKNVKAYPGIDFLSDCCYVLAASAVHPDTKTIYKWEGGRPIESIKQAPQKLIDIIRRPETEAVTTSTDGCHDDDAQAVHRYSEYLSTVAVGEPGDVNNKTYAAAARGKDFGLSPAKILELMEEIYNPRNHNPRSPQELTGLVNHAANYAKNPPGNALPQAHFKKIENDSTEAHEKWRGWDLTPAKLKKTTMNNVVNHFLIRQVKSKQGGLIANPLQHTIGYNSFSGRVMVLAKLPWEKRFDGPREWRDMDSVDLKFYLSNSQKFDAASTIIEDGISAYARMNSFHPLQDYLKGLVWDQTPRVEKLMIDHGGAQNTKYARVVSKIFLLQAVNRAMCPGCKADYTVVFESGQGKNKTQLLEILGGEWYADLAIDPHHKDTVDAMCGKWFVELGEMEVTKRKEADALKRFLSARVDRVRLAYGRRSQDLRRSCVFVGTINPDALGTYLTDTTGNRRFLPMPVGHINIKEIAKIRDQLFAEAMHMRSQGVKAWIEDSKTIKIVEAEQKKRQTKDPWLGVIQKYITQQPCEIYQTEDIWIEALQGSMNTFHIMHQRRIAACLKDLGYERTTRRVNCVPTRVYAKTIISPLEEKY